MKSVMIGFRVSETVNTLLTELADNQGVTVSTYVQAKIEELVNSDTESVNKTVNSAEARQSAETKQEKLTELRQLIAGQGAPRLNSSPVPRQSNARLPLYNHLVHKAGDKVLMDVGGALRETIVPELDQDGQQIESAAPVVFGHLPEPVNRPVDMSQPVTMLEKPEKKKRKHRGLPTGLGE